MQPITLFFYRSFLILKDREAKNTLLKFKNILRTNRPENEERPRTFILDTAQDHENNMFLVSVVHDLIFLKLLLYSFHAGQGSANSIKRICVSGWFALPVGLYFRLVCTNEK